MNNANTDNLILESIMQTKIVHADWTQGLEDALMGRCEDSVDCGNVVEFWGTDDEGDEWRVHLDREETDAPYR